MPRLFRVELPQPRACLLTPRQRAVLVLYARGYPQRVMAAHLGLSPKTIDVHRSKGLQRLGLCHRVGLMRYAFAQGWLDDFSLQERR